MRMLTREVCREDVAAPTGYVADMTTTPNEPSPDPDVVPSGDPPPFEAPDPTEDPQPDPSMPS